MTHPLPRRRFLRDVGRGTLVSMLGSSLALDLDLISKSFGSGINTFTCLIIGAWQVARDRNYPGNLLTEPLPARHHLARALGQDIEALLAQLTDAIQNNLQGLATAIVHRYGELNLSAEPLFRHLVRFAVSEDGALHAEKYFQTVWDDFHATRPAFRWRHLVALARVTASECGKPAAGQSEARELLGVRG